jgi:putative ABC transport system permease protein
MRRADIDKELRFHIDARVADLVASGASPDEARRQALVEFGGVVQTTEAICDARHSRVLNTLRRDIAYALRMMRRTPVVTAVAVCSIALGIGASTAIFSVIDNLLFRPPFLASDRLVCLYDTHPTKVPPDADVPPSPGNVIDWRERARSFDHMVAWRNWYYSVGSATAEPGRAESVRGVHVSPDFFAMLGVSTALGRTFVDEDARPGHDRIVILSHALWSRRFNADPAIVGRNVLVDARPVTVVGVLPDTFQFYQVDLDLWMPWDIEAVSRSRQNHSMMVFARLAPGVTAAEAQSELDAITTQLAREHPDTNEGWAARVAPLYPSREVRDVKPALIVLLAASGLVLLIACVNVANLLLTRGIARQREMVIRSAIGASRSQLIRQMATESLVLASLGAVFGSLVAHEGVRILVPLLPHAGTNQTLATLGPLVPALNLRVLAFTIAGAAATGAVFGLVPAFQTTRVSFLKASATSSTRSTAGRVLVIAELTMAIVLLAGASVLMQSFVNLQRVHPGFRPDHLVTTAVWLPNAKYAGATTTRFYEEAIRRVERLPGVRAAGGVSYRPMLGMAMTTRIDVDGSTSQPNADVFAGYDVVTPGYLSVIEQPLTRGRDLEAGDGPESEGVVVVNETMARRFWPDRDPVGQKVRPAFSRTDVPWATDASARWLTVVGVAADIKEFRPNEPPRPVMYLSQRQFPSSFLYLMVRTSVVPESLFQAIRREIGAIDRDVPTAPLQTMDQALANAVPRFNVALFVIFAAIALALSTIGVYGVTSHGVTQRTREIGIRMALGARGRDMVGMVVREILVLGLIGTAAGIGGALVVTRAMRNMLYGVSPGDPRAMAGAAIVLLGAAIAAAYLPARRAAQTAPTIALKGD